MKPIAALLFASLALASPLLTSCGSSVGLGSETGGNYASTKIKSSNQSLIRSTTVAVFQEAGFSSAGGAGSTLYFEKVGSRSAQIAWGSNLNDNPVIISPEIRISPRGPETVLVCNVFMVQQSTVYGENSKQPHLMGKSGYNSMLSTIRKRVEAAEEASSAR